MLAATPTDDRLDSMVVFFLIALAIIGPYGYVRIRRVLRERLPSAGAVETATPDPEHARAADPSDLSLVIAAIDAAPGLLRQPGAPASITIDVPGEPTLDGRPVAAAVATALLIDAIRSNRGDGWQIVAEDAPSPGSDLELRLLRI
ncbi:MAG TPA: hypothetical protein PKD80_07460 [Microthrixaceae bacterium]|nr:hypothetical protein [Microthrixaceae bacterium]HMT24190.1 hypothetical protein [Microthrixaceae bacterium]